MLEQVDRVHRAHRFSWFGKGVFVSSKWVLLRSGKLISQLAARGSARLEDGLALGGEESDTYSTCGRWWKLFSVQMRILEGLGIAPRVPVSRGTYRGRCRLVGHRSGFETNQGLQLLDHLHICLANP